MGEDHKPAKLAMPSKARASGNINVRVANNATTLDAARALVRAHLELHSVEEASIQHVVDALPSPYIPPTGALWVAYDGDDPLGCAAFQTIAPDTAELKRVFVRPEARRRGVARALTEHAIETIRAGGYTRVRLGTQSTAIGAQRLYESLGFTRIEPYRKGDFGIVWFYELVV
jgi:ribosomal protein S18 acetylase RimI-like enzyme